MMKYAVPAAVAAIVVLIGAVLFFRHQAEVAKEKAEAAVAQAQTEQRAREALETYTQQTIIVRERGNAAVQHIYESPDASTPVPDGVLSAWRSGIDSVRNREASDSRPVP